MAGEAVVLFHHVLDVLISGDGDEGIEVFVGELVLEGDVVGGGIGELGELGLEGGEGGRPIDGDHAGVSAHVAELVVVGAGEDTASEAAHDPDRRLLWVGLVVGSGGGGGGFGLGGVV